MISYQKLRIAEVEPLNPPLWAKSGHAQTILAHLIPSPIYKGKMQEIEIPLQDGDLLKAYIKIGKKNILVSVFHGLAGNISADYMQRTAELCDQMDFGFVLVNHRGAGTGLKLAKNPYHSGRGEDLSDAYEWLRNKYPKHMQIGIGISMSGSMMLNLLTGNRGQTKPDAAITVNAPLDLLGGALMLQKGLNRIYDFRFIRRLSDELKKKQNLNLVENKYRIPYFATMYDFDQIFTGPATEFKTRENYYASCSMKNHLEKIDRPTLMLQALDDPFISAQDYLQARVSPFVKIHLEEHGGHVGYLSACKNQSGTYRWLDYFLKTNLLRLTQAQ